jgi:hypothetical protein
MRHVSRILAIVAATAILTGAAPSASPLPGSIGDATVIIIRLRGLDGAVPTRAQAAAAEAVVVARLAALPEAGASVRSVGEDRLRIDVGEPHWIDSLRRVATAPGILGFLPVPAFFDEQVVDGAPFPEGAPVVPVLTVEHIASIARGTDGIGQPVIDIELTSEGASLFDAYAFDHLGERIAIVLDGIVLLAPVIQTTDYDGRAQISGGGLDGTRMDEIMAILSGGQLPVTAEILAVCPAIGECPMPSIAPDGSDVC